MWWPQFQNWHVTFVLGSVCFGWKWNSEIIFRKITCLVGMVNSVKLKIFSVWPKIKPKTTEIIFSPYFHFKRFPPLSHTHSSLTHALPLSKLDCSDPHTEPNGMIHTNAPRSWSRSTLCAIAIASIGVDRDLTDLARSVDHDRDRRDCDRDLTIEIDEIAIAISPIEIAPIAIAIAISLIEIAPIAIVISPRKCDIFWVLFVFLGMNDIMCLFGNWENVSNK